MHARPANKLRCACSYAHAATSFTYYQKCPTQHNNSPVARLQRLHRDVAHAA